MAEIGDYGYSAICSSYKEACRIVWKRRAELEERYKHMVDWEGGKLYNRWAIWYNGEFVVGNWPRQAF